MPAGKTKYPRQKISSAQSFIYPPGISVKLFCRLFNERSLALDFIKAIIAANQPPALTPFSNTRQNAATAWTFL